MAEKREQTREEAIAEWVANEKKKKAAGRKARRLPRATLRRAPSRIATGSTGKCARRPSKAKNAQPHMTRQCTVGALAVQRRDTQHVDKCYKMTACM